MASASAVDLERGGARCMLRVSMGNANFEGARLEASVEWISERFAPRETVLNAGDAGRQLCILLNGRAEVSLRRANGQQQQIAAIEQGSVFGEQAFLDGQPRSATVNAISECEVRSLAWKDFLLFREKHPLIACDVLADIGRTLSLRGRRQLRELQFLP